MEFTDTIAAIATAPGRGGIAVIRISGPDALKAATVLTSQNGSESGGSFSPRHAYFRKFYDAGSVADEGVLLYFSAPNSYTGEDVVELQGHGGNIAPQRLLSAVLNIKGIRQAEPGEFTRRAFLNGKMDLTAAEAVEDLISAGSDSAARAALASLDGVFADRLNRLTERLTDFRVHLEACLDFPEEHEDFFDSGKAAEILSDLETQAQEALKTAECGVKLNEGARIVLAGKPNAGKSSLLNALAGTDKAIVTNIPGTTRDVLTVNIEIGGIPVTVTDTAGLRDSPADEIEAIGIKRALNELRSADLILMMVDSSGSPDDVLDNLSTVNREFGNPSNLIVIRSKTDLPANPVTLGLLKSEPLCSYKQINCSVKSNEGMRELRKELHEALGVIPAEGVFSARRRHLTALHETADAVHRAGEMLELGDLVLTARETAIAQEHLGTITGKVTSDDILGKIFSTFCIGK